MVTTDAVEIEMTMSWTCPMPGCDWNWPGGPLDIRPSVAQRALLTVQQQRLVATAHELSSFTKAVGDHFNGNEQDHSPMVLVGEILRLRYVLDCLACTGEGPEDNWPDMRELARELRGELDPPVGQPSETVQEEPPF